jgi:hypothetical protein
MEELQRQIKVLEAKLKVLEDWKSKKERQQLQLPLDEFSKNIINNYKNS